MDLCVIIQLPVSHSPAGKGGWGEGGVLNYMTYTEICRWTGYLMVNGFLKAQIKEHES